MFGAGTRTGIAFGHGFAWSSGFKVSGLAGAFNILTMSKELCKESTANAV